MVKNNVLDVVKDLVKYMVKDVVIDMLKGLVNSMVKDNAYKDVLI